MDARGRVGTAARARGGDGGALEALEALKRERECWKLCLEAYGSARTSAETKFLVSADADGDAAGRRGDDATVGGGRGGVAKERGDARERCGDGGGWRWWGGAGVREE